MTTLEAVTLAAVAWSVGALAWAARSAWRRPSPRAAAAPAGTALSGIVYAFGAGMSPRAKESASHHPLVYVAGLVYHAGVLSGGAALVAHLAGAPLPASVALGLGAAMTLGAAAGLVLLARRRSNPLLQAISAPDDYASNAIVDAWLASGALAMFTWSATPFLVLTIVLALYAPLGKIRHCVFFFLARGLFGTRLGRRGVVAHLHGSRS